MNKLYILSVMAVFFSAVYAYQVRGGTRDIQSITFYSAIDDLKTCVPKNQLKYSQELKLLDSIIYYTYTNKDSSYEGLKKLFYYNRAGVLIETKLYSQDWHDWSSTSAVTNFIYDKDGLLQETRTIHKENYYPVTDEYLISKYTYNEDGTISVTDEVTGGTWHTIIEQTDEFFYNEEEKIDKCLRINRRITTEEFYDTSLITQYYYIDSTANIEITTISEIRFYDGDTLMINRTRNLTEVNERGDRILSIDYDWNSYRNTWLARYKEEVIFGEDNKVQTKIASAYDTLHMEWKEGMKKEFIYNTSGDIAQVLYYIMGYFTNDWELNEKLHYYYSYHQITDINAAAIPQSVILYPNPARNKLYIKLNINSNSIYYIRDICGSVCKSGVLNKGNEHVIDVSKFSKGIYCINFYVEGEIISKKIVIQ